MYCSRHLLVHFYGIDLADTLSLCSRCTFSALSLLMVVRWKNGPHSLKENSLFYLPHCANRFSHSLCYSHYLLYFGDWKSSFWDIFIMFYCYLTLTYCPDLSFLLHSSHSIKFLEIMMAVIFLVTNCNNNIMWL